MRRSTFGPECIPTRRYMELTALRAHPMLWTVFPAGDLSAMPHRLLAEIWNHDRAERSDLARRIGLEVLKP